MNRLSMQCSMSRSFAMRLLVRSQAGARRGKAYKTSKEQSINTNRSPSWSLCPFLTPTNFPDNQPSGCNFMSQKLARPSVHTPSRPTDLVIASAMLDVTRAIHRAPCFRGTNTHSSLTYNRRFSSKRCLPSRRSGVCFLCMSSFAAALGIREGM